MALINSMENRISSWKYVKSNKSQNPSKKVYRKAILNSKIRFESFPIIFIVKCIRCLGLNVRFLEIALNK